MDDQGRSEADALVGLARSFARSRCDLEEMVPEIEALVAAAVGSETPVAAELGFERAARRLRAGWLRSVAAETSRVLRSPTEREMARLEHSRHDAYGYERDFQPETLEARCQAFFGPPPAGWATAHVLFSSGQAALATILLQLAETRPGKLRMAHVGSYFETRDLANRVCTLVDQTALADCIVLEPIACDGRFTTHDPAVVAQGLTDRQTLVVDETLSAPATRLPDILRHVYARGAAVIRLVSGLKLLQQGLELANVGIVSMFGRDADKTAALAEGLRRCRTLTGAGLRFVDALALEAPFFLDRDATQAYADRVFAHNAALARAVAAQNRLFEPLSMADSVGPYCAFKLASGNGVAALEAFADGVEREAKARGLLFERGGSFGFRGHRYEVIEPETHEPPFLRIAMGARDDHSCQGIITLIAEFAAQPK